MLNIGKIHEDAAYFKNLNHETQFEYEKRAKEYIEEGNKALENRDEKNNILGNLFPGDPSTNQTIKDNLDPPKRQIWQESQPRKQQKMPSFSTRYTAKMGWQ